MEQIIYYVLPISIVLLILLIIFIIKILATSKKNTGNKVYSSLQLEPINIQELNMSNSLIDQVRTVLLEKYNIKINQYNKLKEEIETIETEIVSDNSSQIYKDELENLKKQKLKNNSEEYNNSLTVIQKKYNDSLVKFEELHNHYMELRREASLIDLYGLTKKIKKIRLAKELKDINLTEEKANQILIGEVSDISLN